jgi:hypothetical protein
MKFFLLTLGVFIFSVVHAQQFGGNPSSIRWLQLETDSVRFIFPSFWKGNVQHMASLAGKLDRSVVSLGNQFRKFDIVLQPQTTLSNAYVGIGPRRSEFFLTPLQNSFALGSLPWADQLMLHEFRHIHQFNNFNKGFSRLFYFLGGQLGLTLINNAAVPNWFWEGDAVYQETRESNQGRGRLPSFFNGFCSLWLAEKNYSWMKLRNGSLRDYVPDHYQLGYLLTAYGWEKKGEDFWRKVTDDAVRFRKVFYPFQAAVRRHAGLRYREFVRQALDQAKSTSVTNSDIQTKIKSPFRHFAGDQEFPHFIDTEQVMYISSSYRHIPAFVIRQLSTGEEKTLRVRDISLDNHFSYRNGKVVYAAFNIDPRWGWRDYSEIRLLDTETGFQRSLTRHTCYFSPDISEDGKEIVAVEMTEEGNSRLQFLSAENGEAIGSIPNTQGWVYTYPKFMGQTQVVSAVRNTNGEMGLLRIAKDGSAVDTLIPFSMHVIGFPQVSGDTIIVTASMGASDQMFLIKGNGVFLLQPDGGNNLTGNYQAHILSGRLAWTHFTEAGYRLKWQSLKGENMQPFSLARFREPLPDFGYTALQEKIPGIDGRSERIYPVQKYSKGYRLINFHSWIPSASDPEYGLRFLTENVLNTLQGEAAFTFNRNEQSKQYSFSGTYGALYPWIRSGISYTMDRSVRINGSTIGWDEWQMRGGLVLPLQFIHGRTFTDLRVSTDYVYTKTYYKGIYKDSFSRSGYGYFDQQLVFSHQSQQARQHIFPRYAQSLRIGYANAVQGLNANQFLLSGSGYFPGIFRNHHFVFQIAWQQRDTLRRLFFSNSFPFSRGYTRLNFHRMFRWGINYHFPVVYPDRGLADIVYFLRVRANVFYDDTRVQDYDRNRKTYARSFRSAGMEVYFDSKWWNQHPLTFGIRYARLLDPENTGLGPDQWEFILPVNLIGR